LVGKKGSQARLNNREKLLDFKKMRAIIWKNWLVMKGDRMRLISMLIFPVLMISIFGFATTGSPRGLPAALVDEDHSPASMALSQALRAVNAISIRYEVGSQDEAKQLMDAGHAKAMILIPAGFGDALETGATHARVVVKVDESDATVAQMVRSVLQQTVAAYSRQQALAKLAALQARQQAASQALGQGAAALNSISSQLTYSSLQEEKKTLQQIASLLQSDMRQADEQILGIKNQIIGFPESVDVMHPEGTFETNASHSGGPPAAYDEYLAQIQVLEARKAVDAQALASVYQLLAENAAQQATNSVSAATSAETAAAMNAASQSLDDGAQVILEPIAYEEQPAYAQGRKQIDFLLPAIIAMVIFQGATMGMGRALAGEKKDGSLTRVFLTPTSNATILTGTMLFYSLFESLRSSFLVFTAMILFGVTLKGSLLVTLLVIIIFSAGCTAIGLLLSALSNSQEQYTAISMLVSLPTMFLSGVFLPVQTMPPILQGLAEVLPISYAATALRGVMIKGFDLAVVMPQVLILTAFTIVFTAIALVVFKREIA